MLDLPSCGEARRSVEPAFKPPRERAQPKGKGYKGDGQSGLLVPPSHAQHSPDEHPLGLGQWEARSASDEMLMSWRWDRRGQSVARHAALLDTCACSALGCASCM